MKGVAYNLARLFIKDIMLIKFNEDCVWFTTSSQIILLIDVIILLSNKHLNMLSIQTKYEKKTYNKYSLHTWTKINQVSGIHWHALHKWKWKHHITWIYFFLLSTACLHPPLAWTCWASSHFQSNHVLLSLFQPCLSIQISVSHRSSQMLPLQPYMQRIENQKPK